MKNVEARLVIYSSGRKQFFVNGTEICGIKAIDFVTAAGAPDLVKLTFEPKSFDIERPPSDPKSIQPK